MTRVETVAAYNLAYDADGEIRDVLDREFNRIDYSRMKYGDIAATDRLAASVTQSMTEALPTLIEDVTPPDFLVAYKAVPPACYYLSRYCLDRVNIARLERGNEPGRLLQVYKNRVAATNYAAASEADRRAELNSIGFSVEGRNLRNSHVVILDDIRITGGAERKILEVVSPVNPRSISLGYIALFDPVQAVENPSVESDLNTSTIQTIADLLPSIAADNFDLNIRTLKLILASSPTELEQFLEKIPERLVDAIHRGAVDTGPDFVAQYRTGFDSVNTARGFKSKFGVGNV